MAIKSHTVTGSLHYLFLSSFWYLTPTRGDRYLTGSVVIGQEEILLNLRGYIQVSYKKEIPYGEGGETLEPGAQRSVGSPIHGNSQGQVGQGIEQAELRHLFSLQGVGLDGL